LTQNIRLQNHDFPTGQLHQAKYSPPWRAMNWATSPWRPLTHRGERWLTALREQTVFTPKTQFSITQTPKLIGITAYMYFMT